jgi:hypothetical protein
MGDELQTAKEKLNTDEKAAKTSHDWSTFIKDLDSSLKDPKLQAKQDELKKAAQDALKDAGFGDVKIDGVSPDGKKILEHKDGKAKTIDAKGAEADLAAPATPADVNKRDAQGRVTSNDGSNTYGYDSAGKLNSVTWQDNGADKTFKKNPPDATHPNGQWVDDTGKPFAAGGDPVLDQKTGDLTYKKDGSQTCTEKADGGFVYKNDDGTVDKVYDKAQNERQYKYDHGKLVGVDYTAKGSSDVDPAKSWTKNDDGTWKNGETPPKTAKDITVDPKTGDYTEVSADGTKKHVYHTNGTDEQVDNKADQPPPGQPQPHKGSLHDQWVAARKQARADSENDVNTTGKHTIKFGDTMWDVAKASAKKNSDDHHDPTNTEIAGEVARLKAKYDKAHPGHEIANINNVPIGTEIDTSPDKPAEPPQGPQNPNDVKGTAGQTMHYSDAAHTQLTGVDYANGMKSTIGANGDVSVTGDPASPGKDYKLAKQADGSYKKVDSSGADFNPPQTFSKVDVDNTDGTMTLTSSDKKLVSTVNPDGKATNVHFDGQGTDSANVTEVDYPNGMKVTPQSGGAFDVTGDPATGGKEYKLVKASDNTYSRENPDGSDFDKPPQTFKTADLGTDGSLTLTSTDGKLKSTINSEGGTTNVHYDGQGTDAANVQGVDYPNGMKAKVAANGDYDVTGDPANGGTEYKLVKQADGTYKKTDASGADLNPPQTYSKAEVDPDDGSITLTGKKDGKDHTTTINADGSTTEADVTPPAPPQQGQPTADKAVVVTDPANPSTIKEIDYVNGVKATVTPDSDGSVKEIDFVGAQGTSKLVKAGDHYELQPPQAAGDTINKDGVTIDAATGKVVMKGKHQNGSPCWYVIGPNGDLQKGDGDPPA